LKVLVPFIAPYEVRNAAELDIQTSIKTALKRQKRS
jgi:hypothetical protein